MDFEKLNFIYLLGIQVFCLSSNEKATTSTHFQKLSFLNNICSNLFIQKSTHEMNQFLKQAVICWHSY